MTWIDFARLTVMDPRRAGMQLAHMSLDRDASFSLLGLLAIANGVLYWLLLPADMLLPPVNGPVGLSAMVGAALLLSSWGLSFVGRMLGGAGDFDSMLRVTLWVQVLRLAAQLVVTALSFLVPPLAALASFAVGVWGLYIVTCLVTEAHGFSSLLRGLAVLSLGFVAAVMVLAVLLTLFGASPQGTI